MRNPDRLFIDIAERVSQESRCVKMKVGAVLTHDERIISIGYNGTPQGYKNCDECFGTDFVMETHHDWSVSHEIHAEMNAILFAAKEGIPTEGCTLYVTHEPCDNCLKNCIAAGIKRIVYMRPASRTQKDTFIKDFRNSDLIAIERFGFPEDR